MNVSLDLIPEGNSTFNAGEHFTTTTTATSPLPTRVVVENADPTLATSENVTNAQIQETETSKNYEKIY